MLGEFSALDFFGAKDSWWSDRDVWIITPMFRLNCGHNLLSANKFKFHPACKQIQVWSRRKPKLCCMWGKIWQVLSVIPNDELQKAWALLSFFKSNGKWYSTNVLWQTSHNEYRNSPWRNYSDSRSFNYKDITNRIPYNRKRHSILNKEWGYNFDKLKTNIKLIELEKLKKRKVFFGYICKNLSFYKSSCSSLLHSCYYFAAYTRSFFVCIVCVCSL